MRTWQAAPAPLLAADAPPSWGYRRWPALLPGHLIAVSGRFDAEWERGAIRAADMAGLPLVSIRASGREALIGPGRPAPGAAVSGGARGPGGCPGCAQARDQARDQASGQGSTADAGLGTLVASYLGVLAGAPLAAGELAAVATDGTIRRHQVRRARHCSVCGGAVPGGGIPAQLRLTPRPASTRLATRGDPPFGLDPVRMREELLDPRYGPVTRIRRQASAPFALTEASLAGAQYAGYGRGRTFRTADAVAVLEAYERAANIPRTTEVIRQVSKRELGTLAMDPAGLGRYTPAQLAAPSCRLREYRPELAMDWVWGHRLSDGSPVLVPAEIGFYRYAYPPAAGAQKPPRACFEDSSSGSALGGSYAEAALHGLLELAERDAFLLAWHRAVPLPSIDPVSVTDAESVMLADVIRGHGYDLHLLAATADLAIPVVWALAVHRELAFPATFSSAGASPDPMEAIRSALWELGQLVKAGQELDEAQARRAAADHWRIAQIEDHIRVNALPALAPRVTRVLGGQQLPVADAFPGWPDRFIEQARGDVTAALRCVAGLYAAAGLDEILLVDQSSAEHTELGLTAVKAVVPGIVPMCFGHAHQRLAGLPRLARAMQAAHGQPPAQAQLPLDPHPFP